MDFIICYSILITKPLIQSNFQNKNRLKQRFTISSFFEKRIGLQKKLNPTVADLPKMDIDGLRLVEHHIHSNLKKAMPITELATIVEFRVKIEEGFKRVYGTSIFKYITGLRMSRASELIRIEGLSVAQAVYEVGYSNPQHFTNAFKRTYGYLPSLLKK